MDDSEAEELMVDAAVNISLQSARINSTTASSSRTQLISPNPAAVLRAEAAERRLALAIDEDYAMDVEAATASESDSEDEQPLLKKGKKNANIKLKIVTVQDTSVVKHMTASQLRKHRAEQRRQANVARKQNKKEEQALMRELGRRLTYVRG